MEALCYGRVMLKLSHSSAETWQAYKEAGCAYIAALRHNSCEWEWPHGCLAVLGSGRCAHTFRCALAANGGAETLKVQTGMLAVSDVTAVI